MGKSGLSKPDKRLAYNRNMKKHPIALTTFRNTIGAIAYIFLVSQIINNGELLFGNSENSFLGPFAILLLFVLSAAVVGGLLFGQAIYLFFEGKRKDSIKSAIYSIGWLFVITATVFVGLVIF